MCSVVKKVDYVDTVKQGKSLDDIQALWQKFRSLWQGLDKLSNAKEIRYWARYSRKLCSVS